MLEGRELARTDCPPAVVAATLANCVQYHLYDGELDEASALNDAFLAQALEIGMVDAEQWWAANTLAITYVQGTAGELADAAGDFADRYPEAAAWRCTHAFLLTEAGRVAEARDVVDRFDLRRPEMFPVNDFSLLSQTYLGYVALRTGDHELGRATEAVLRPYEQLWANVDIFTNGPISAMLAAAVGAQGRYDEADELFARADALLDARGLQLVRNPVAWSRAFSLLQSDRAEHRERAAAVISEAVARTKAAGLDRLTTRFETLPASTG